MYGVECMVISPSLLNTQQELDQFFSSYFLDNQLIGPFFYNYTLNDQRYLELLEGQILPAIRAIIPQNQLNNVWFQQDGRPAHNVQVVQTLLRQTFNNKVISNGGPVNWPARSPDITPLDFYLWGYVKNEVYEFEPPETIRKNQRRESGMC